MDLIERGQVWLIDFNPIRGREQSGIRPALVISVDRFNNGPAELIIAIPITTRKKNIPLLVEIFPPEGGIERISYIKCEDIRSLSKERLVKHIGKISDTTMDKTESILRLLMNL